MSFSIDTGDVGRAQRELAELERGLRDLTPLWSQLDDLAGDWMGEQFASAGAWGGTPWEPLSPAYAAQKARRGGSRQLLVDTGSLLAAAEQPRASADDDTLELTIDHPLAAIHSAGSRDLPARPLFPEQLPAAAERDVDDEAADFVDDLLRRTRL